MNCWLWFCIFVLLTLILGRPLSLLQSCKLLLKISLTRLFTIAMYDWTWQRDDVSAKNRHSICSPVITIISTNHNLAFTRFPPTTKGGRKERAWNEVGLRALATGYVLLLWALIGWLDYLCLLWLARYTQPFWFFYATNNRTQLVHSVFLFRDWTTNNLIFLSSGRC